MRWLLSLFAVVGLAGALPLTVPSPAYACSCAFPADGSQIVEQVSHAASVFGGIVTGERVEGQTAFYEFDVREVFEGDVGARTVVASSVQGSACGRGFETGVEYIVFTSTHDTNGAPWSVNSCSATTVSTDERTRDAAVSVYGTPRTPDPQISDVGIDDADMSLWWVIAVVGGVIVLALVLIRWRR